ncbi:MAG: DUF4423 domain-containing protein [Oligoflexales bacterium]
MNILESLLSAKNYREIIELLLHGSDGARRKGVTALAAAMRCHSTFIAKVLGGNADFSMEQALSFAEYFSFPDFESQFFVDLVQVSRAADQRTKRFFENRLETMRQARSELSQRLGGKNQPPAEIMAEYYGSWIPQYIHIACQTEGRHSVKSLAEKTQLSEAAVAGAVRLLVLGGLLEDNQGTLRSVVDFIHLPRQSYLISTMHQQWRLKAANDIGREKVNKAMHFSGLMSIDRITSEKIRELLTDTIANIKPAVASSKSDEVFFLGIDFYQPL